MIWVTYRQHRWLLLGTVVLLVALWPTPYLPIMADARWDALFGAVVAVFWGAPLLAREFEERTHVFAWSQDVRPSRWLVEKVVLLGGVITLLAFVLGVVARPATLPLWDTFEQHPLVQIGYAWFGFTLGLACSVLLRRTVPAMALALFVFTVLRVGLARWGRESYLQPVHTWRPDPPPGVRYQPQLPRDGLWVASGYADKNGDPMPPPLHCQGDDECLKANGQIGHFVDYQPGDRMFTFQLIEFGIFAVLAVLLLVVTFRALRRAVRPRPKGTPGGSRAPAGFAHQRLHGVATGEQAWEQAGADASRRTGHGDSCHGPRLVRLSAA